MICAVALSIGSVLGRYEVSRTARRWRHGRGLCARDTPLARRRDQGPRRESFATIPSGSRDSSARPKSSRRSTIHISRRSTGFERPPGRVSALVMELVDGRGLWRTARARRDEGGRGAADRAPDRLRARSGARARHHPSRSQAGEYQGHPDGAVKVLDFGLAKAIDPTRSNESADGDRTRRR